MSEQKPFNDAVDHLTKIEGYPEKVEIGKLPKPLRFFGYFVFSFFSLSILFIILMNLLR
jgi:hypothetical protein